MTASGFCPICNQPVTDVMTDGGGWCPDHGRVWVNWSRTWPETTVLDRNGARVARGMEIEEAGLPVGLITDVTPLDADYSDTLGRVVAKGPLVRVEFGDGSVGEFGPGADYECRDIEGRT